MGSRPVALTSRATCSIYDITNSCLVQSQEPRERETRGSLGGPTECSLDLQALPPAHSSPLQAERVELATHHSL